MKKNLVGWIFDAYAMPYGMRLWIIDASGHKHTLFERFSPSFYIGGPPAQIKKTLTFISRLNLPIQIKPSEGIEFYSAQTLPVVQVTVINPLHYMKVVQWVISLENKKKNRAETLSLYNADLSLTQHYFFSRTCFPLAFCEFEINPAGEVLHTLLHDSIWATDYSLPPLSILYLKMEGTGIRPDQRGTSALEVKIEGKTHVIEEDGQGSIVKAFDRILLRYDPDLILSEWGDPCILPQLIEAAKHQNEALHLNRDLERKVQTRKESSYFSYGQVIHKSAARLLFGRWHIDARNSFLAGQCDLEGVIEFARLSKIPVQQMARTSTGTGITSMQVDLAFQDGILIPWRKREAEGFKSALQLLKTDKGGLTYTPKIGFHEEVAELDFASMYPAIMLKFNISPETINCTCCQGNAVPEIGHRICQKRRGLVPRFLAPLLKKRARYKILKRTEKNPDKKRRYEERQSALKWGLVTTFGYQGYKNARFGKIEAHEAITAYSREKLLQAKEIAEDAGYDLIHAIVDSLFLQKKGTDEKTYAALAEKISIACEIPIAFEGIFNWVLFPPSKSHPGLASPSKYLGVYRSGKTKLRGIEARRSDVPAFIKQAQLALIEILKGAKDRQSYEGLWPQVMDCFEAYQDQLHTGQVPFCDLAISKTLSKLPHEYKKASLIAIVANELAARGVRLMPGMRISYVITDEKSKVKADRARALGFIDGAWSYDVKKYEAFLEEALQVLCLMGMKPRIKSAV